MHVKRGHHSEIRSLGWIGFFSILALAATTTIWAVYLESYLHSASLVGFVTAAFSVIGTLAFIFGVPLLERLRKVHFYTLIIGLICVSYLFFSILDDLYAILALGAIVTVLGSFRISLFGIIVREKSRDTNVAKNEGFIYTIFNTAFVIAPLLAGYLASTYGIRSIFLFGAGMFFITIILLKTLSLREIPRTKKIDKHPVKLFFSFFKDKEKILAYILGGGIDFWWILVYLFVPIYMIQNGLSEKLLGYFLAGIAIPLILAEYRIGGFANKHGFKKVFFVGFSILALAALACFFITNIYVILAILILSSFGAAMTEPTSEAYFFDVIKKNQREKFYPTYNTVINVSTFFARALPALVLLFLPFKFVFIVFAVVMAIVALLSLKAKNVIENK